jgi:two-component system, NtrC family, response regulator GlrR
VATSRASRRTPKILVVDDDPGLLRLLTIRLRSQKYEVEPAENAAKALSVIARFRPDLVITDLRMAEMDGIALLRELQRRWPGLNVIMLTAHGTIPDAVKATQSGAFAFLTKPVEKEHLLEEVARALKTSGFADTTEEWRTEFATRSPLVEDRLSKAHLVAGTDSSVLITGEPGTGKELLARAIHRASGRREGPFISLDCSALDGAAEHLPGSEQALAQAIQGAHAGTLFLRNVDDLALNLQARLAVLLRGERDVRVLATGDRRPDELAADARYSTDLLEQISAVHIDLPPLGKRREDIPLLAAQCLDDVASESGQPKRTLSPEAMEALASAKWPGNVRQLRMVVRQVATLGAGPVITVEQVQDAQGQATQLPSFDEARDEFTRNYLVQLLQITQGNVSQAARMAKRNRTDFYKLLTKHELKPEEFKD